MSLAGAKVHNFAKMSGLGFAGATQQNLTSLWNLFRLMRSNYTILSIYGFSIYRIMRRLNTNSIKISLPNQINVPFNFS